MVSAIRQGLNYARGRSPAVLWSEFICPTNRHPLVQFSKYVILGVLAAALHNLVFGLLGWGGVLPHFSSQGFPKEQRAVFFVEASLAGFVVANIFAYFTNVSWVFERGRHNAATEFFLFIGVASIGFFVGVAFGVWAILAGSGGSWLASLILLVSAAAVNYVTRKFLIFRV